MKCIRLLNIYPKNKHDCLKAMLVMSGFDFSLIGTIYMFEMLIAMCDNSNKTHHLPTMSCLADRHEVKIKTFNRSIRFAIEHAYSNGCLKHLMGFEKINKQPSTKNVALTLYNNMLDVFVDYNTLP